MALLRYDWLAATLLGLAFLKRRRPASAGVAFAYATAVRLFPVIVLAGIAARGVRRLVATRRLDPSERRLVGGFLGAAATIALLAFALVGTQGFRSFGGKMKTHTSAQSVSIMRVGLPVALTWEGEGIRTPKEKHPDIAAKRARYARHQSGFKILALALFLMLLRVAPGLDDEQLLLLGFAVFPLALQASYYYYALLMVPFVIHASRARAGPHLAALAFLCGLSALAHYAHDGGWNRYSMLAIGSWLLAAYSVALFVGAELRLRAAKGPSSVSKTSSGTSAGCE